MPTDENLEGFAHTSNDSAHLSSVGMLIEPTGPHWCEKGNLGNFLTSIGSHITMAYTVEAKYCNSSPAP